MTSIEPAHDLDRRLGVAGGVLLLAGLLPLAGCGNGDATGPGDPTGPRLPEVPPGTVVFLDDVDSENGGVPTPDYTGWTRWNVLEGCVDLHGPGDINPLPGHGLYMDLDGSCDSAGTMESKTEVALAPGNYVLEFIMAGNNQSMEGSDELTISVGSVFQQVVVLAWDEPFELRTYPFTVADATSGHIRLAHAGGDLQGILVDAVRLREE